MNIPFSKGHDPRQLLTALVTKTQASFDAVTRKSAMKLVSPQTAIAPNFRQLPAVLPVMPADDSRATAAELLDVAGGLLLADFPFMQFGSNPLAAIVANTLAAFGKDYPGPTTPSNLFQRSTNDTGPFISQFLLIPPAQINPGPRTISVRTGSYGTTMDDLMALRSGNTPKPQTYGPLQQLPFTPRTLASVVHQDRPYALGLAAAWILGQLKAPLSSRFSTLKNESGFVTYGGPVDLDCAIAEVTREAMRQCWYLKFKIARRRRPEEMQKPPTPFPDGFLPLVYSGGNLPQPAVETLHPDYEILGRPIIDLLPNGLLPLIYAEGAPGHSSWPSGHAVIGGAIATLLKAWYADGDWLTVTKLPIVESPDGFGLSQTSTPSTIHNELNKLAWNYGQGRCFAGIHFRSDCTAGLALGEAVTIQWLSQQQATQNERLQPVTFTRFDGTPVTVT